MTDRVICETCGEYESDCEGHASSNRACTCVDAGYVVGSDPNCPRHAIPNSAAAIPGAATGANPLTHATPNRVLELEDDEEQRIVVGALEQYADTKRYTVAASTADRKMLDRQGAIAKSLAQRLT